MLNQHLFSCVKAENISVATIKEPHLCDNIVSSRTIQNAQLNKNICKKGL